MACSRIPHPSAVLACVYIHVYMDIHVYSTLARLVVKEEKKENPDPIHHIKNNTNMKHTMTRTPGCPALRTGHVYTCIIQV